MNKINKLCNNIWRQLFKQVKSRVLQPFQWINIINGCVKSKEDFFESSNELPSSSVSVKEGYFVSINLQFSLGILNIGILSSKKRLYCTVHLLFCCQSCFNQYKQYMYNLKYNEYIYIYIYIYVCIYKAYIIFIYI